MKFLTALRTELGQLSYSLKARKTPQQWRDQYAAIRGIRIFNTPSIHYRGPRTEVWGIAMVKDEIDILPYIQRAQSHHQVGEPVPGNWIRRSLVYFGEVSFAFYLVHEIVIFRFIKTSLGSDMIRMDARGNLDDAHNLGDFYTCSDRCASSGGASCSYYDSQGIHAHSVRFL